MEMHTDGRGDAVGFLDAWITLGDTGDSYNQLCFQSCVERETAGQPSQIVGCCQVADITRDEKAINTRRRLPEEILSFFW